MSLPHAFEPGAYSAACAELLQGDRLCPLGPGSPRNEFRSALQNLDDLALFADRPVRNRHMAAACRAGLWLWHNFLDESHRLSQGIPTVTGSFWHGIMHRREHDFPNAKYWFNRVGEHPVYPLLAVAAAELSRQTAPRMAAESLRGETAWDPIAFVDLCQAVNRGQADCEEYCRRVAQREWELLFDYCYRAALGAASK